MLSNSEIRRAARDVLGSRVLSNEWLYTVLVFIILSVISGALSFTFVGVILAAGAVSLAGAAYTSARVRGRIGYKDLGITIDAVRDDLAGCTITGILYTLFITLWSLLFVVPGIVKSCSYAMTFYIKNDHPEYSATEAITESRRLMNGNKMRYFLLQLSFIGWLIVGVLCLGVGVFWVESYMQTANAIFYEELLRNDHPARDYMAKESAEEA